jgi:hypothetical protein
MEERVRVRNYTPAQRLRRNEYDRIWHERRRRQMGVRPISQSEQWMQSILFCLLLRSGNGS